MVDELVQHGHNISRTEQTFQEDVTSIVIRCRKSGLADAEIINLFHEVVNVRPVSLTWWLCKWSICCCVFIVPFFVVMSSVLLNYKPTEYYIDHYGQHFAYPLLRGMRALTLPFAKRVDITSLYYKDCLLENPFYQPVEDCTPCEDVQVHIMHDMSNVEAEYNGKEYPFVCKNAVPKDINLKDILKMVEDNISILQPTMKLLSSENTTLRSASDLLNNEVQDELGNNADFHLLWRVRGSGALKIVRDLSWRPPIIPAGAEIHPSMFIQMKGAAGAGTLLPLTGDCYQNVWLTQAHGESRVILSPVVQCKDTCKSFEVLMDAKDILFFNAHYWEVRTIPRGSDINLQFISTYY